MHFCLRLLTLQILPWRNKESLKICDVLQACLPWIHCPSLAFESVLFTKPTTVSSVSLAVLKSIDLASLLCPLSCFLSYYCAPWPNIIQFSESQNRVIDELNAVRKGLIVLFWSEMIGRDTMSRAAQRQSMNEWADFGGFFSSWEKQHMPRLRRKTDLDCQVVLLTTTSRLQSRRSQKGEKGGFGRQHGRLY